MPVLTRSSPFILPLPSIIDAKMMETIPLLNEVNLMAEEMGKPQRFDMQLMANPVGFG